MLLVALATCGGCDRGGNAPAHETASAPITLFAAASMREVVTEITDQWKQSSGQQVRLQFEASSTLARQIQEGAHCDLFISASPEWVDLVKPTERKDWLSNRLVVVVRKEVERFDLAKAESLALANEQVPAGKYARAALAHLGVALPARTIYGANVRDVLLKVSQGGAQAGIVYDTDAALDPEVRVALTFPPDSHPKIVYVAALLAPVGRDLYDALAAPWAAEIARKRGFIAVD